MWTTEFCLPCQSVFWLSASPALPRLLFLANEVARRAADDGLAVSLASICLIGGMLMSMSLFGPVWGSQTSLLMAEHDPPPVAAGCWRLAVLDTHSCKVPFRAMTTFKSCLLASPP